MIHQDRWWSYRELDRQASLVAQRLRHLGAEPESRVAVCLEPAPELLAALLGVLKAGAAYVPIMPSAPAERTRRLIADSRSSIVITQRGALPPGAATPGTQVITLTPGRSLAGCHCCAGPAVTVMSENLAYIMHTSGSSGEPKGVMVSHGAIHNTLRWRQQALPLRDCDRLLVTVSFTVDASIFQLFQPLSAGAAVVFPGRELAGDPARIISAVRQHGVTVLCAVPPWLAKLADDPGLADCETVRLVFSGGEVLPADLADAVAKRLNAPVNNMYGPTETAMEATFFRCTPGHPVSIGKPIANMRACLLDQEGQPAPPGGTGELYLSGAGLARGYLNDPALTAARFLPDPNASYPGARMYRTGDFCRWLPDGSLEYLGRRDRQVKLNGHRVELPEVEAALRAVAGVREAAVLLRDERPGGKHLVGYVAGEPGAALGSARLRRELRRRLPAHLVPAMFVIMEALPRTPVGKVDRLALPAPRPGAGGQAAGRDRAGSRPQDPLRELLRNCWRQVLGMSQVGDDDDFFELGGSSLQAAILTHRLEDMLGEPLYAVAIYDAATIEKLAGYLRQHYRHGVRRVLGHDPYSGPALSHGPTGPTGRTGRTGRVGRVGPADVARLRALIRTARPSLATAGPGKNPPAVFILSPPRSGSTLLRVMLGAHPRLFAPPELQLLSFGTLRERRAAFGTARDDFWLQGTIRALMELEACDAQAAARLMRDCEERDMPVKDFYRFMQSRLGDRTLVDKTPAYTLDPATLRRAEEDFEGARYLHLVRHPSAVIRSFEEAKLHVFFQPHLVAPHPFTPGQLAELVWDICHENIRGFLGSVPADRRHTVSFERLVEDPHGTMRAVSEFLGLPFHPATVAPHQQDQRALMTDPVHPMARMLGDVKFSRHRRISAAAARRRQDPRAQRSLGVATRRLAAAFGYEPLDGEPLAMVCLQAGGPAPALYCVHPAGGSVWCYRELARLLGERQPCYAFRARSAGSGGPAPVSLPELAASYLAELRRHQPQGPYLLAGWSFGGIVAFEMAAQLVASGLEVPVLALISSYLPADAADRADPSHQQFIEAFLREHGLPSADPGEPRRMRHVFDQARRAGLVAPGTTARDFVRVIRRHEELYRGHVSTALRYRPSGTVPRLVLFETEEPGVPGPCVRWEEVAGSVSRVAVPGDHYSVLQAPYAARLADALRSELSRAAANPVSPDSRD